MARAALTEEEIESFRRKAVRAATKLFAERGYEGVTLRAIAEKLGTSAMAPYRYFENKAEIFALVRADAARRFADALNAQFESTRDPAERLMRIRTAYVQFALCHPDQYTVMFAPADETSQHAEVVAEWARCTAVTVEAVQLAVEAGVLKGDPNTIAHLLWAFVHGLVSLHNAGLLTKPTLEDLLQTADLSNSVPHSAARQQHASRRPRRRK